MSQSNHVILTISYLTIIFIPLSGLRFAINLDVAGNSTTSLFII